MEEKENKKIKMSGKKKAIIAVSIIAVLGVASNAYASTNGYGNIFFMIKNLITTGTLSGAENLLSDKEIIISYSSIEVMEGLKIQANKVTIENDKTTLYLKIMNEKESTVQLEINTFKDTQNGEKLAENKYTLNGYETKEEKIIINKAITENSKLVLEILDEKSVSKIITIDLSNKEILVDGNEIINKQSEVELKQYLGYFSILNCDNFSNENEKAIYTAKRLNDDYLKINENNKTSRELINDIIDSFYMKDLEKESKKTKTGKQVDVLKVNEAYSYDSELDAYMPTTGGSELPTRGICLDIKDISYLNGVYTIKYDYCLPTSMDYDSDNIENIANYQATIQLSINEDSKYSKYKIISLTAPVVIKESSNKENTENNTNINENENISKKDIIGNWSPKTVYINGKEESPELVWGSGIQYGGYLTLNADNTYSKLIGIYEDENKLKGTYTFDSGKLILKNTYGDITELTVREDKELPELHISEPYNGGSILYYLEKEEINQNEQNNNTISNSNQNVNVNTNINTNNTNNTNEKIDNYSTSLTWKEYKAPGLRFEYPTIFEVKKHSDGNSQGALSTEITGIAKGINKDTNEIVQNNMKILIYEPEYVGNITPEEYYAKVTGGKKAGASFRNYNGLLWYNDFNRTTEGNKTITTNIHTNCVGEWGIKIEIITDEDGSYVNYKILNIVNAFLGSTKRTNY